MGIYHPQNVFLNHYWKNEQEQFLQQAILHLRCLCLLFADSIKQRSKTDGDAKS
ncbi:hypothetical protein HanIR_Chr05g0247761 [Helianthus annuus]|nr:hypothetical protein HanIR_Chr05g0247761 [Helianthus annuus]